MRDATCVSPILFPMGLFHFKKWEVAKNNSVMGIQNAREESRMKLEYRIGGRWTLGIRNWEGEGVPSVHNWGRGGGGGMPNLLLSATTV